MPIAGPGLLLTLSFFLPAGDLLLSCLPAPPVNLFRRSNEVGEDFLLAGSGDLDSDKVEETDFSLSLVTELFLLGDLETVFCLLSIDLDGLCLLGDLEPFFRLLSFDLDELRLLGDLEPFFRLLSLDLDCLRLLEEDLCLLGLGDFDLSLLLSGLRFLPFFSLE